MHRKVQLLRWCVSERVCRLSSMRFFANECCFTQITSLCCITFACSLNAVRESVNKSAASAASLGYVKFQAMIKSAASAASRKPKSSWGILILKLNFQAVIKSAASAASRKPKSREGSSRGVPRGRRPPAEPPCCTPLELPSLDLSFLLKAALAADLITA